MVYRQQRWEATEMERHDLNVIDNMWEELEKQDEDSHESAPQ